MTEGSTTPVGEPVAPQPRRVLRRVLGLVAVATLLALSVWLSVDADRNARSRARGPVPVVDEIAATFDERTFTTTYTAKVRFPTGQEPAISWTLEAEADCGVFTSLGSGATWTHPHVAQRDHPALAGFPADRLCPDGADAPEAGHAGVVRLTVISGENRCVAVWPDGSSPGRVEKPDTDCTAL